MAEYNVAICGDAFILVFLLLFPNQACLKGFLLPLKENCFGFCGRAVPQRGPAGSPSLSGLVPPAPRLAFSIDLGIAQTIVQHCLHIAFSIAYSIDVSMLAHCLPE